MTPRTIPPTTVTVPGMRRLTAAASRAADAVEFAALAKVAELTVPSTDRGKTVWALLDAHLASMSEDRDATRPSVEGGR